MMESKHEIKIIEQFLRQFNRDNGTEYYITECPEDIERMRKSEKPRKAVEAIARDDKGGSIAFEHTLIQPFVGDKDDAQPLLAVFAPLEQDSALTVPEHHITVTVPIGAVRTGINWTKLAAEAKSWFQSQKDSFPEGLSAQTFSSLLPNLTLSVEKAYMPGLPGRVFVCRNQVPDDLIEVLNKAFSTKLPKLIETDALMKILILEKDTPVHANHTMAEKIEHISGSFPELDKVNSIWVVNTVAWEADGYIEFAPVWSEGLREYPG